VTESSTERTPAKQPYVVRAEGVVLWNGRARVLRDVNLIIEPGQLWVFVGPERRGKTMLAEVLVGAAAPALGKIDLHPTFSSRERIGFVPRTWAIPATVPTTVRELVSLGTAGIPRQALDEGGRIAGAMDRAGLPPALARANVHALSAEQRRRVLIARALVRHPGFLVADEPTFGLDPAAKDRILGMLAGLNRDEHLTIVIATHDLDVAERWATHVALFTGGSVKAGRRALVLTQQEVVDAYAAEAAPGADGAPTAE
jgi:ABC-type Mn2+/Zn2+ transport system ATPase subunit